MINIRPDLKLSFLSKYMDYFIDCRASAYESVVDGRSDNARYYVPLTFSEWLDIMGRNGYRLSLAIESGAFIKN